MTILRFAQHSGATLRAAAAVLVLLPVAVTPALAAHRHPSRMSGVPTTYDTLGGIDRDQTDSISSTGGFGFPGRSMRSSTLGNAEFPERDPIAQNLGTTSGGGF